MSQLDLVKPWRLIISLLPLLYGIILILELPQSFNWSILSIGIILFAVMIAGRLELPMLALWPTFIGLFVLSACIFAFIEDLVDYAIVPFTDTDLEIILVALIACGFIVWGIRTTRRMIIY